MTNLLSPQTLKSVLKEFCLQKLASIFYYTNSIRNFLCTAKLFHLWTDFEDWGVKLKGIFCRSHGIICITLISMCFASLDIKVSMYFLYLANFYYWYNFNKDMSLHSTISLKCFILNPLIYRIFVKSKKKTVLEAF